MDVVEFVGRSLLSGGGPPAGDEYCLNKNVTYGHRVDNPEGWNWCLVPDGGFDAVFFAGLAIAVMCLVSPRWDALMVLILGAIYEVFSFYYNLEHVSNAVALWLGMRPADIFVYVFLPPFLLDLSVRIDFFRLKKVAFNIVFMAFIMVVASALILIPFMLYALDLKSSGWSAAHVALFGSMIASTDAASVSAVLRAGGGPEILSVLLEGECLFNDASSLTLFEIFKEVVQSDENTTLAHDLEGIVVRTIWSTFVGVAIGVGLGIVTRWVFAWLQHRNMEAQAEVAWSVAGAYLSFYITQVWCHGSGCIGAVAFGLYGSATLLWGMSTKARLSGIFLSFWQVMTFIINGLIFFYVGASAVNFTIRSTTQIAGDETGGVNLTLVLLYKLPIIWLTSFALRFILMFTSFKFLQAVRLSEGLPWQQVVFITVGGLRGSLSLVLAQTAATLSVSTHGGGSSKDKNVKAEIAIYTAGYVVLTLLVNAPLCGPLMTLLGLDRVRPEQLAMRGEVKGLFRKFTATAIEDLAAQQDEDELLQGLDWASLRAATNMDKQLDREMPEVQPQVHWCQCAYDSYSRFITAPLRLWRWFFGDLAHGSGDLGLESEALDRQKQAAQKRKEAADVKRTTAMSLARLTRAESRAPGGVFHQGPPSPGRGGGGALIIRDPATAPTNGEAVATGLGPPARKAAMSATAAGLRRSVSRRLHGAASTGSLPTDDERTTAALSRGMSRSSHFLDRALEEPAEQTARAHVRVDMGEEQDVQQAAGCGPSSGLSVVLPPSPSEAENNGGLADPILVTLSPQTQHNEPAGAATTAADGGAGGGASVPGAALGSPQSVPLPQVEGSQQQPQEQADAAPGPGAMEDATTTTNGPSSRPNQHRHYRHASLGGAGAGYAPSPLSRTANSRSAAGDTGPSSPKAGTSQSRLGPSSLKHHSVSYNDLHVLEAGGGDDTGDKRASPLGAPSGAAGGTVGQREDGKRELLQSMLVIKPGGDGASTGLPMGRLAHNTNVRMVQRLGDDTGRGSALEALRAEPGSAAGGGARSLGRASVRQGPPLAVVVQPGQDLPSPVRLAERPLGHKSASVMAPPPPTMSSSVGPSRSLFGTGSLATTSAHPQAHHPPGWEPPSIGPYEFALPEDAEALQDLPPPQSQLPADAAGISSGLARPSTRPGGGGGALGRSSVKLGRQAGLAAASINLARIYDADPTALRPSGGIEAAGAAAHGQHTDGALGRRSVSVEASPGRQARHSFAFEGPPARASGLGGGLAADQARPGLSSGLTAGSGTLQALGRGPSGDGSGVPNGQAGPRRDVSGRGNEFDLSRRTRFADPATAAALAKASVSRTVAPFPDVEGGGVSAPLLVEYRLRLLAGLRQYYRQKHAAGSLSPASYKVLSYVADQSAHQPEKPLELWSLARKEVSSGPVLQLEANCYFRLKSWTAAAKAHANALVRAVVPRLLVPFVWLLSSHISATTLSGLETAVELWVSLTQSLQTEWLQYSGLYGEMLLEEVQHEADGAWAYIIERRIEAPNKFGAVQTHRAIIELLAQQQAFVREMNEGGMIDESECRKIVEAVERRLQVLARRGPRWQQPTVMEILSSTPMLRGAPPKIVEWIRSNSIIRMYQQGAAIWDMGRKRQGAEPDGLIIVLRGVVRMMVEQNGVLVPYYLGAGGVGGLISCVLEDHVPGMSSAAAYAEGNALGKGPVVMHVPWSLLQVLRRFSRDERLPAYQALELALYRNAAVYVLDLLRHQVTAQFSSFIRSSLATIVLSKRLDGPSVRRQRIRLLMQVAAVDHHVDGGIDWVGELLALDPDTVRQMLLAPSAAAGAAVSRAQHRPLPGRLPHTHVPHIASMPSLAAAAPAASALGTAWAEAMYKAIASATNAVLDMIRGAIKEATLVVLSPGQGLEQRTTMALIQGSLEPEPVERASGAGGAGGPFVASSNEQHVAPSLMVWVSDYFEGELVAQQPMRVVAGPRGATLLMWGLEPEEVLTGSAAAGPSGTAGGAVGAGAGPEAASDKRTTGKEDKKASRGSVAPTRGLENGPAMRAVSGGLGVRRVPAIYG